MRGAHHPSMAYLFYVDESGTPDLNPRALQEQPLLVMAAVGIQDRKWKQMEQAFRSFLRDLGLASARTDEFELKGREIYRNPALPQAIANLFSQIEPVLIASVIDKQLFANQGVFRDPYVKAYEFLVERVDRWVLDQERKGQEGEEMVILVMDARGGEGDYRLQQLHRHFLERGTSYQGIYRCIEQPFLVNSRITPGVQIADVVAHIIGKALREAFRLHQKGENPVQALRDSRFAPLVPYLRRVQGEVNRYGLKIWPEDRWQWIYPLVWESLRVSSGADLIEQDIPF